MARADGEPAGPLVLDSFYFDTLGVEPVTPVGRSFRIMWWVQSGFFTGADLSLSWTGDDTLSTSDPRTWHVGSGMDAMTEVPGVHSFFAVADYRRVHHWGGVVCTNAEAAHFVRGTNTWTIVAVTNVLASTNDIAVGTNTVTLTAQMTPVDAGQLVSWGVMGGASLTTNQGLTTGLICDAPGEITVTATCGSSSASTTVRVYAVTAVTASPNPVAAGDDVTLTATVVPGGCPLPLNWNISADTGMTVTTNFPAGYQTVTVTLGDSSASCVSTDVNVADIKYEAVPSSGNWLPWPSPPYFPKGSTFRVRAIPNPYDPNKPDSDQWPGGKPVWGGEASGAGPIGTVTFGTRSTNATDLKLVTATCGNAKTNTAVVYEFNRYYEPDHKFTNRTTNVFGVGEVLTLKPKITPDLPPTALGTWLWTVSDDGDGLLENANQPVATYFGPERGAGFAFSLEHVPAVFPSSNPLKVNFTLTFVNPDIKFVPYVVDPTTGEDTVGHVRSYWHIELFAKVRITPDDVSWKLIKIREIGGQALETTPTNGFFAADDGFPHPSGIGGGVKRYIEGWRVAAPDWLKGPKLYPGFNFTSYLGVTAPTPPFSDSSAAWKDIPWIFQVQRNTIGLSEWIRRYVTQKFTCDAIGTSGVDKGFETGPVTRGVNLPIQTAKIPPYDSIDDDTPYSP